MTFRSKWLIANKNSRHLEKLLGNHGTINYHIKGSPFNGILETEYGNTFTYKIRGSKQSNTTRGWIKTIINHLDPIINIDFRPVRNINKAHLIFLAVKQVSKPWSSTQQVKASGIQTADPAKKELPMSLPRALKRFQTNLRPSHTNSDTPLGSNIQKINRKAPSSQLR